MLFCRRCRAPAPVRERLLLVLPDGELHEYLCAACGASVGTRKVTAPPIVVARDLGKMRLACSRWRSPWRLPRRRAADPAEARFGKPLKGLKPSPLAEVLANPENGKTVRLEGTTERSARTRAAG